MGRSFTLFVLVILHQLIIIYIGATPYKYVQLKI